jgi:hypothetical protein
MAAGLLLVAAPAPRDPQLHMASGTPDDVVQLAADTWGRFVDAFPAAQGCLGDLTLVANRDLTDRGRYDPERAVVTIRIPGTAGRLAATMIHEFAHHLDARCPALVGERPALLEALGHERDAPWDRAARWEDIPAEQFAETAVVVVLGRRSSTLRVTVTAEAVELLGGWGG